ncbi:hypothetical protein CKAN_00803700 [Cinnamomum micranthum f. kanehirae]|uniref:Uncharacterized protein n=1 Tax=Cinnamomum micranthum f. kanehirae TaxID=337451 RepID=A0A3S5WGH2_9MAGN|nr:hypothetical protein CKAN_00803700 [Cinnamomum micranthum f. kanehirae]
MDLPLSMSSRGENARQTLQRGQRPVSSDGSTRAPVGEMMRERYELRERDRVERERSVCEREISREREIELRGRAIFGCDCCLGTWLLQVTTPVVSLLLPTPLGIRHRHISDTFSSSWELLIWALVKVALRVTKEEKEREIEEEVNWVLYRGGSRLVHREIAEESLPGREVGPGHIIYHLHWLFIELIQIDGTGFEYSGFKELTAENLY